MHLVLGVERRHPDDPSPRSHHAGHLLDRKDVEAADRQFEVDSTEDLEPGAALRARYASPAVDS